MTTQTPRMGLYQQIIFKWLRDVHDNLIFLDWSRPLTRDDISEQWPDFPEYAYMRLPAAKGFATPEAIIAALRHAEFAELDDIPEAELVSEYGGPPAWGPDPLFGGEAQESGSATDTARPA